MFRTMTAIVGALTLTVAMATTTQARDDYTRAGLYLGGGLGLGTQVFDKPLRSEAFKMGIGAEGWLGFRLSPRFGVEAQLEYLDGFNLDPLEMSALTFTGNAKCYLLLAGRMQPFALAGLGVTRWDSNTTGADSAFSARFGGGVEGYLTEDIALVGVLSYVLVTGDLDPYDYFSIGLGAQYRF